VKLDRLCTEQEIRRVFARGWLSAREIRKPDFRDRPATGKENWRYDAPKPLLAGVTVTAGDLIFTGELTSDLLALDARTGKVLLRRAVDGPSAGGVVTYDARGVQNVAIVSGFVGVFNSLAPDIGGANTTVTIFRLRGK
jgi:hypothetical protein